MYSCLLIWGIWHAVDYLYFLPWWYLHLIRMNPHHEQVVLYEDELADNGVSLLTVKVVNTDLVSSVDRLFIFCLCKLLWFQSTDDVTFWFYRESCQALGFFSCNSGWVTPSSYTKIVNFVIKFFKWSYAMRIASDRLGH